MAKDGMRITKEPREKSAATAATESLATLANRSAAAIAARETASTPPRA